MREARDAEIVRIPFLIPREEGEAVITFQSGALLETAIEYGIPAAHTAKQFVEMHLGQMAAELLGTVGYFDNIHGLALHSAANQPVEIPNAHRGLLKIHNVDEYIADKDRRHSFIDVYLVQQALKRSRGPRQSLDM